MSLCQAAIGLSESLGALAPLMLHEFRLIPLNLFAQIFDIFAEALGCLTTSANEGDETDHEGEKQDSIKCFFHKISSIARAFLPHDFKRGTHGVCTV
jgi:hypothetical protein